MAQTHRAFSKEKGWHDSTEDFPPYRDMEDVREANRAIGNHWFDPDTLRFFRSRISDDLHGGRYFVSSEQGPSGVRRYSIREARPDGTIETVGDFQQYGSRSGAVSAIRRMIERGEG